MIDCTYIMLGEYKMPDEEQKMREKQTGTTDASQKSK